MALGLPLKKLVVEWRYKPDLGFFGKMDAAALEHIEGFPNWERSPLTVEIRNRQKHRRLFLASNRAFFEVDDADPITDFSEAGKLLKKTCTQLSFTSLERLGVRQWFAADLDKPFALMADEVTSRFLSQNEFLSSILVDKVEDAAYVVDYETEDGWKYHLRLGPMTKKQWFELIHHEARLFETTEKDEENTFKKYRETFPENFLHIDIDCFKEGCAVDKSEIWLNMFRGKSQDLVQKLINYCKRTSP